MKTREIWKKKKKNSKNESKWKYSSLNSRKKEGFDNFLLELKKMSHSVSIDCSVEFAKSLESLRTWSITSSTVCIVRSFFTFWSSITTVNKSLTFALNLSSKGKSLSPVTGTWPHLLITASRISWTGSVGQPKTLKKKREPKMN